MTKGLEKLEAAYAYLEKQKADNAHRYRRAEAAVKCFAEFKRASNEVKAARTEGLEVDDAIVQRLKQLGPLLLQDLGLEEESSTND